MTRPRPATPLDAVTAQWTRDLYCGVRSIDLQHQELIALLEALESLHAAGRYAVALDEMLPQLKTYVLFHFDEEEQLMRQLVTTDSFARKHVAQHRKFSAAIATIQSSRTPQNDAATATTLRDFLADWLVRHIATTDRELARRLLAQNPVFFFR